MFVVECVPLADQEGLDLVVFIPIAFGLGDDVLWSLRLVVHVRLR